MQRYLAAAFVVIVLAPAPASGATQGRAGTPPEGRLAVSEVQGLFDAYTIVQAQEALQLDDDQYGRFVTRMKTLQQTRRRHHQARIRALRELAQAANHGREGALRQRLAALRELDVAAAAELRKAYDLVDEVLDLKQQARFRVFEERMEQRKLELLLRARQRTPNRGRP